MASIHCCWKSCPNKTCEVRKRGRHCPRQRKIESWLEVSP